MNRFHNKYHRHNHHSTPTTGEPDSAHDPIASKDDPFKGEFHVDGALSAVSASINDLTINNNLTVMGKTHLGGDVFVESPITYILEHLTIVPKATTQDFYFKIDSQFTDHPLTEVYLKGNCVFMITSAADVGIGVCNPRAKLDVNGDVMCLNLSANNASLANLAVSGGSHFNSLTADNTSQIGFLEIGFVPSAETYIKTISGNRDLYLYTGNNLNAKFHPNNDNFFTGKVGIGMEPIEKFTLSGQQGFRQNGLVLLDNSYNNTLRIITNRAGDDDQHLFTFTYDGRFVVGDVFHDYNYPCTGPFGAIAGHKINSIDTSGSGANLSLTNVAGPRSNINDAGANLRFFRVNGDLTDVTPVSADQVIGSMRAYGYTGNTCFGEDRNAAINFVASDVFSNTNQGAYTTFETTCATDITNGIFERVRIDHNGNVGINTPSTNISPLLYRQTTRPDWKFTVKDFDRETRPAAVIFAGVAASPMMQVIGGEGVLEQTALMLSDRNINDANTNHIEFTHGASDAKIARVSSLNRGAEGIKGGSLLFSTTNGLDRATSSVLAGSVVDPVSGDLFVCDYGKKTINRVTLAGVVTLFAGQDGVDGSADGTGAGATFSGLEGITIDAAGNFYVADKNNNLVRMITPAGVVTTLLTGVSSPDGVCVSPAGDLYICANNKITRHNLATGTTTANWAAIPSYPEAVASDSFNNIYVACPIQSVVYRVDAITNAVTLYAGIKNTSGIIDGPLGTATLTSPYGLAVDAANVLYISEYGRAIRRVSLTGDVTTLTSAVGGYQLCIDAAGNLYTNSGIDGVIQRVTPAGVATTVVTIGSGATGFVPPFERARINFDGDMGIGIKTPSARLHVHDDDKSVSQASGILRDVVTVSTLNNTNGILLSSADLQSRVYNNNNELDLHISTCTTGGSIKFDTDNEAFAAIITDTGVLGINVDESIKAGLVNLATTAVKLAVNGDVLLFNSTGNNALSAGSRLFFNQSISSANTDPMFIHRVNTDILNTGFLTNVTELRVNIGDDICGLAPAGAPTNYKNTDVLSVGNYSGSTGAPEGGLRPGPSVGDVWNKWIDVGHCSTVLYNNLSVVGDATFDGDVTIKGALSVVNPGLAPTIFKGDLYVDGNIFATGNITGFCGCAPPAFTTSKGTIIPAGWGWGPPHPPVSSPPVIPSDARLKLNAENISNSLEKILLINGVTFNWDETKQTQYKGRDVGVIAQEIEKILPEIVHEQPSGYKGVQYEKIIPLLIECIKELKTEIDELKSKK